MTFLQIKSLMQSDYENKLPTKAAYVSELLNETNYLTWEQEIKFTLEDENCKDAPLIGPTPNGENPFRVTDSATTCRILLKSVDAAIRVNLLSHKTGPAIWNYLYQTYSGVNNARKFEGIKAIALFKFGPGSVGSNFERIRKLVMGTHIAAGKDHVTFDE